MLYSITCSIKRFGRDYPSSYHPARQAQNISSHVLLQFSRRTHFMLHPIALDDFQRGPTTPLVMADGTVDLFFYSTSLHIVDVAPIATPFGSGFCQLCRQIPRPHAVGDEKRRNLERLLGAEITDLYVMSTI